MPPIEAASQDYGDAAARADVETVVSTTGRDYLAARARLVAHPQKAAAALLAHLGRVPAPSEPERRRILTVLAELRREQDVGVFLDEFRRAVTNAPSERHGLQAAESWRPLLRDLGRAVLPGLRTLISDRSLSLDVRSLLLADAIALTEPGDLPALVELIGVGDSQLRETLTRELYRRARISADERAKLLVATDRAIESVAAASTDAAAATRFSALLQFRARLGTDQAYTALLTRILSTKQSPFVAKVAALRGLARSGSVWVQPAIERTAHSWLEHEHHLTQAGEILTTLALRALHPDRARNLARVHALDRAEAPRLASIAFELLPTTTPERFIERSQSHPWPEVRATALRRLEGPCSRQLSRRLARIAGRPSRGGDRDPTAARAAIAALGRCNTEPAIRGLTRLLRDAKLAADRRAEAGRQLARHGGPKQVDVVAREIEYEHDTPLAVRLAAALGFADAPTPRGTRVLCSLLNRRHDMHRAATEALARLYDGEDDPARSVCDPPEAKRDTTK